MKEELKMKRMTIGTQLSGMFGIALICLTVLLGATVFEFQSTSDAYQDILQGPVERTIMLKTAQESFQKAIAEIRGYIAYGNEKYGESALDGLDRSLEAIKNVTKATTSVTTKQEGEKLQTAMASYSEDIKKVIAMKKANDPGLMAFIASTRSKTELINKQFEIVFAGQSEAMKELVNRSNDKKNFVIQMVIGFSIVSILLVITLMFWYSRNLAKRMNALRSELLAVSDLDLTRNDIHASRNDEIGDMAEAIIAMKKALRSIVGHVRNSADSLAASSQELTSTVEEQLRTSEVIANTTGDIAAGSAQNTNNITEISAIIEEVTAGAEEVSASAAVVNNATQEAVGDANQGMQLIQKVVFQNETIENSMKEITDVSSSLVKGSGEIQQIITVISNIAGQTNLLALNAAIEAARAGDAGRGFAVVAEEVRKLAEQSADATRHIGKIIQKMTADIEFSVNVVTKANSEVASGKVAAADAAKGFEMIVNKLGNVQTGMGQITHAIEETAKGMQVMVVNVQNISAVSEETSASTQTVAAAAEEQNASLNEVTTSAEALAEMATELNGTIQKFRM